MTQHELDALAVVVAQMTPGAWASNLYLGGFYAIDVVKPNGDRIAIAHLADVFRTHDTKGIVALVNAAPDLLRLAQRALETQERRCETCREQIIQGDDPEPVCGLTMEGSPCYFYCEVFGNTCGAWQRREGLK